MKRILIVAGLFISTIAILTACSEAGENQEKEKVKQETYNIGDTVSINGLEITINSAKFVELPEYALQPENERIIEIDVSVKNNKDEKQFVDNTQFELFDEEGNMLEQYYGLDKPLSGDLRTGKKITGKVYFDVNESNLYELYYEPQKTSQDNTEIKYELKESEMEGK